MIFDQVNNSSGAKLHSSDAMALTLEPNRDYLIGVAVTGGSFASYLGPSSGPQPLSFGSTAGAGYAGFGSTLTYVQYNYGALRSMSLTTTLP